VRLAALVKARLDDPVGGDEGGLDARRAAPTSSRRIRAWACGLRTKAACSMPGAVRSPT
jgi:hypothetical protein